MDSPTKRRTTTKDSPPDGGYGWFVLLATFFTFGWIFGSLSGFGVLFVEISQYFSTTATETSWIFSTTVATLFSCAPIGTIMSARFGHRAVVMTGGALAAVGMVTGAMSQNIMQLYLTVGFLSGLGYALTWTPTVAMLAMYFDKHRPLANGLASAGECIMTFLITPFFQLLIDWYSWKGAMLILGALALNLCVCGALLRPLPFMQNLSKRDTELEMSSENVTKGAQLKEKILLYIDYTLITNKCFMLYTLFGVFSALGFFAAALYLVPYARSQGVEEYQAASLMSVSAACDLVGRLACGWLANLRLMKTITVLITTALLQGVVLLLCPLATSFTELVAFSAIYGLMSGGTISSRITVLNDVVGAAKISSALSISMFFRSISSLLGPFILGVLIDRTHSYTTGFLAAGVAIIVAAFCLVPLSHDIKQEGPAQVE